MTTACCHGAFPSCFVLPLVFRFCKKGGAYSSATEAAAAAAAAHHDDAAELEAELVEAKENLRLLQLQSLKYSTVVVIFQVGAVAPSC